MFTVWLRSITVPSRSSRHIFGFLQFSVVEPHKCESGNTQEYNLISEACVIGKGRSSNVERNRTTSGVDDRHPHLAFHLAVSGASRLTDYAAITPPVSYRDDETTLKLKLKTTFYTADSVLGYRGAWRRA